MITRWSLKCDSRWRRRTSQWPTCASKTLKVTVILSHKHLKHSYYRHVPIDKVWIYRLLFFVCLCVCTVTDFSGEDKASGVNFCTVLHRRPEQGISHFGELCSHRSPKWTNRPATGKYCLWCISLPIVNLTLQMRRSWNISWRVDVGSACVDRGIKASPQWRSLLVFLIKRT